jgi:F-type H+-transporting ATPase subunit gamma
MSNTTASLRHKIDSAEDLQGVVRTMKAVAASRIGQYEQSVIALNDYYRSVELGLRLCLRQMGAPLVKKAALTHDTVGAIVFGSDQGLVGQFNESLAAYVQTRLSERSPLSPKIWTVGERMQSRLSEAGLTPVKGFHVPQSVSGITPLVSQLLMESETAHAQGEVSALYLFYNRPMSGAVYTPFCHALLPLDLSHQHTAFSWPGVCLPRLVGNPATTLHLLIGEHLFVSLFRACAESLASENASRLAAMQRADKNIDELLTTLNRDFYRLRQSGIDEELFDVIAGFEALKR